MARHTTDPAEPRASTAPSSTTSTPPSMPTSATASSIVVGEAEHVLVTSSPRKGGHRAGRRTCLTPHRRIQNVDEWVGGTDDWSLRRRSWLRQAPMQPVDDPMIVEVADLQAIVVVVQGGKDDVGTRDSHDGAGKSSAGWKSVGVSSGYPARPARLRQLDHDQPYRVGGHSVQQMCPIALLEEWFGRGVPPATGQALVDASVDPAALIQCGFLDCLGHLQEVSRARAEVKLLEAGVKSFRSGGGLDPERCVTHARVGPFVAALV
jgi:hypothetical protein